MFRAIGRWIKTFGYLLTGRIDAARRTLETDPAAVRARYDDVIRDKTARIRHYKQAVAQLISQEQKKLDKLRELTGEVQRLETLKAGALGKAKQVIEGLKAAGKPTDEIKVDADYQKCLSAYNDFSSSLEDKREHSDELETDVAEIRQTIDEHKIQLQSLLREIEDLKAEAADAVADILTAAQENEIAEALAGISREGSDDELQKLRDLRREVKAEAKISKELAGTEGRAVEAEFMEYARQSRSADEFDALIGLGEEAEGEDETSKTPERGSPLPE